MGRKAQVLNDAGIADRGIMNLYVIVDLLGNEQLATSCLAVTENTRGPVRSNLELEFGSDHCVIQHRATR